MATAKKAPAKKAAPKKVSKQTTDFSFMDSAEKAINIYLGVIGQGVDAIQKSMDTRRKENDKRVKDLEKRGLKLRNEINSRFDKLEVPDFDDVKEQFNKLQDQVEEAVENVKEKLTPAKAA